MVAAVAIEGRTLASFAGIALRTVSATGPSTVVRVCPHPAMQLAATRMIAALGATGFIGFDFMIEQDTGTAFLLECNPRPIQICHLGERIGVDLCTALVAALRGEAAVADKAIASRDIALFPQAWKLGLAQTTPDAPLLDIPRNDRSLLHAMLGVL